MLYTREGVHVRFSSKRRRKSTRISARVQRYESAGRVRIVGAQMGFIDDHRKRYKIKGREENSKRNRLIALCLVKSNGSRVSDDPVHWITCTEFSANSRHRLGFRPRKAASAARNSVLPNVCAAVACDINISARIPEKTKVFRRHNAYYVLSLLLLPSSSSSSARPRMRGGEG